jgi:hypothetical protein
VIDGRARFCLVARPYADPDDVVIAQSPPLEWPPTGPESMRALVRAVEELERRAGEPGWSALPAGSAWYAKRFRWDPAASERDPEDRPFGRAPAWPAEASDRWRCEVRWDAGWVESRFRAVAYVPGARRGRAVAASAPLKWQLMRRPDPGSSEHRAALGVLTDALEAAGWTPAGAGASWYARRFSWRSKGSPTNLQLDRSSHD